MPQGHESGSQSESALRVSSDETMGLQGGGESVSGRTGLPGWFHQRCQRSRVVSQGREYGGCLVNYSDAAYRVFH